MTAERADLAIVGAGPAGLAAAATAAGIGLRVTVLDEQPGPGGQVWRGLERRGGDRAGIDLLRRVRASDATLRPRTTVIDVGFRGDEPVVTWLEGDRVGRTMARALILATGAIERTVPFPGWTLPGVMGVGALQTALKSGGLVPDPRDGGLVIAGRGPLVLLYLSQVLAAGGTVSAILDTAAPGRSIATLARWLPAAPARRRCRLRARRHAAGPPGAVPGAGASRRPPAGGRGGRAGRGGPLHRRRRRPRLPCSVLGVHDGVVPNPQIGRLLRLDHEWRVGQRCFAPVTDDYGRASRRGVWVAGDGAGIEGAEAAQLAGRLAGLDVARALGILSEQAFANQAPSLLRRRAGLQMARRFLDALDPRARPGRRAHRRHHRVPLRGSDRRRDPVGDRRRRRRPEPGEDRHPLRHGRLPGPDVRAGTFADRGPPDRPAGRRGRGAADPAAAEAGADGGDRRARDRRSVRPGRAVMAGGTVMAGGAAKTARPDMIVIGGGLIGLSTAVAAARAGMAVTLLEARTCGRHASSASAGGVRSLNRHPSEIAMARAALELWRRAPELFGDHAAMPSPRRSGWPRTRPRWTG